jgi:hypothetical protein
MLNLPVLIMIILAIVFVLAFMLFLRSSKRKSSYESKLSLGTPSLLDIDVKDASAEGDPDVSAPEHAVASTTAPPAAGIDIDIEEPKTPEPPPIVTPTITEKDFDLEAQHFPTILEQGLSDAPDEIPAAKLEEGSLDLDFSGMRDYGSIFETESSSSSEFEFETGSAAKTKADKPAPEIFDEGAELELIHGSAADSDQEIKKPAGETLATEPSPDDIFGFGGEATEPVTSDFGEPFKLDDLSSLTELMPPAAKTAESPKEIEKEPVKKAAKVSEQAPPPTPILLDPEEEKAHEKARRIARVIINDIRNYNPEKLAEGIRSGNIMKTLGIEIERGRQLYIKRVPPEIAKATNYYRESLIKILADGRADLFGW